MTKDILMRIDLLKLSMQFSGLKIKEELDKINENYNLNIRLDKWDDYMREMKPVEIEQLVLFEPKEKYPAA
jgi:hypothetical protein